MNSYTFELEKKLEKSENENKALKDSIARWGKGCTCPKGKACILTDIDGRCREKE